MQILALLVVNGMITTLCFLVLWLIACRLKDASFVDSWWPLGMVLTAFVGFMNATPGSPHAMAVSLICAAWGLRLGLHLLWRWLSHGVDRRYATLLGRAQSARGWSFAKASFWMVFALQAPLQFIVSLPVQLSQITPPLPLGPVAMAGIVLAVIGILVESLADWQLSRFRADPSSRERIMDQGLWRYSRHPNYFGDALTWWGIFLVAAETQAGLWSLPGPLLLTFLLVRVSGIPTLEDHMTKHRPGYADYVRRTSAFVPWPPAA